MTLLTSEVPPREPMWKISVEHYHEMIERGMLTEDDPVELIEGWLITKMPKDPPHVSSTDRVAEKLTAIKPAGWCVRRQDPITTTDSEPEPDVVLARGSREDYETHHPGPADVGLVVEVADSTLERDRTTKLRAYARAGIAVYWIVNLVDRTVEVFTAPTGQGKQPQYAQRRIFLETDGVTLTIDGRELGPVSVSDLLPRR